MKNMAYEITLLTIFVGGNCLALKQKLAIPAYFWPGPYWTQIEQANNVGVAVVNPNSGPGNEANSDFTKVIKASVKAGHKVIGYVDTGYFGLNDNRKTRKGESSTSAWTTQIKEDIDQFYRFYPDISGIFLDDTLNECGTNNFNVNLYKNIYIYIKQKHSGALVVANPGSGTGDCYLAVADILVIFESDYQSYQKWQAPSWSLKPSSSERVWHLIYATNTQTEMQRAILLSKQRNAGYVYVTNDVLPNPWDTLPTGDYWQDELNKAGQ